MLKSRPFDCCPNMSNYFCWFAVIMISSALMDKKHFTVVVWTILYTVPVIFVCILIYNLTVVVNKCNGVKCITLSLSNTLEKEVLWAWKGNTQVKLKSLKTVGKYNSKANALNLTHEINRCYRCPSHKAFNESMEQQDCLKGEVQFPEGAWTSDAKLTSKLHNAP